MSAAINWKVPEALRSSLTKAYEQAYCLHKLDGINRTSYGATYQICTKCGRHHFLNREEDFE